MRLPAKHFRVVFLIPLLVLATPFLLGLINPTYMRPFLTKPGLYTFGFGMANNLALLFFLQLLWMSYTSSSFQKIQRWLRIGLRVLIFVKCFIFLITALAIYILGPAGLHYVLDYK